MITQEKIAYSADDIKAMLKTCEKYNKALERAKDMLAYKEVRQEDMEYLFPELEESKEERIRKAIKKALQVRCDGSRIISDEPVTLEEAIAWLEKQGKENNTYRINNTPNCGISVYNEELKESDDERMKEQLCDFLRDNMLYQDAQEITSWLDKLLEKQGEKKPNSQMEKCSKCQFVYTGYCNGTCILENNEQKLTDNVEPKFHEGDWIVDDVGYYWRVTKVLPNYYELEGDDGVESMPTIKWTDEKFHLWTIDDANDGDVLLCEDREYLLFKSFSNTDGRIKLYCWYNKPTNNFHGSTDTKLRREANIHPATIEQRDLFFSKMKEAGWEWDVEKKEVKKIEVASKESDDERIRKELIEQIAYIIPNNDEVDDEGNALPSYQERINKYRAWLEKH